MGGLRRDAPAELERFRSGNLKGFPGGAYIFQTRVGGGLYGLLQAGVSDVTERVGRMLEGKGPAVTAAVAVIAMIAISWAAIRFLRRRSRGAIGRREYTRLAGHTRRDILKTYRCLERMLGRRGLGPRLRTQTLGDYREAVVDQFAGWAVDIDWLTGAAWAAAYDPAPPSPDIATEAADRLSRLLKDLSQSTS